MKMIFKRDHGIVVPRIKSLVMQLLWRVSMASYMLWWVHVMMVPTLPTTHTRSNKHTMVPTTHSRGNKHTMMPTTH